MVESSEAAKMDTMDDNDAKDAEIDPNIYAQSSPVLLDDEVSLQFTVSNPQTLSGHTVYEVTGVDKQGPWSGKRRYNEFYCLHQALTARWGGTLIAKIPPKKAYGNKDLKFINERRFYLERFLRKMAKFEFLINSEEFLIFSRPPGDIEKSLQRLPRLAPQQMYERMKEATAVNEMQYDLTQREAFNSALTDAAFYVKKLDPFLKNLKTEMTYNMSHKANSINNYKVFMALLNKYEEQNLAMYVDNDPNKMLLNNTDNQEIKDQMTHTVENLKNTFTDLYHWSKGEIYDLSALKAAIEAREGYVKNDKKLQQKKKDTQKDLDNVTAGKKSMRTLLKNQSDTGAMVTTIEQCDRDIENNEKLLNLVTIYLGSVIIPQFKKEKLHLYQNIIQQFNVIEINNAHQLATFWGNVLKNPNIREANDQNMRSMHTSVKIDAAEQQQQEQTA